MSAWDTEHRRCAHGFGLSQGQLEGSDDIEGQFVLCFNKLADGGGRWHRERRPWTQGLSVDMIKDNI